MEAPPELREVPPEDRDRDVRDFEPPVDVEARGDRDVPLDFEPPLDFGVEAAFFVPLADFVRLALEPAFFVPLDLAPVADFDAALDFGLPVDAGFDVVLDFLAPRLEPLEPVPLDFAPMEPDFEERETAVPVRRAPLDDERRPPFELEVGSASPTVLTTFPAALPAAFPTVFPTSPTVFPTSPTILRALGISRTSCSTRCCRGRGLLGRQAFGVPHVEAVDGAATIAQCAGLSPSECASLRSRSPPRRFSAPAFHPVPRQSSTPR